jgi:hypothetical protein
MMKNILQITGIVLVITSVIYELNREAIDFNQGFFSISIGLAFVLVSLVNFNDKIPNYILLISFFTTWVFQIVSSSVLNIEISVDEFIMFFLLISIMIAYVYKRIFKSN